MRRRPHTGADSGLTYVTALCCSDSASPITLKVMHDGQPERVRLAGIHSHELGQPFGIRAMKFTPEIAFGRTVTASPIGNYLYGRAAGDVIIIYGRNLSHEIVRGGLAWWYNKCAPEDMVIEKLESEVRKARKGLRADPNSVPPCEWRRRERYMKRKSIRNAFSATL